MFFFSNMVLLKGLMICACIFTCRAQDNSLTYLIAKTFENNKAPTTRSTPVFSPKVSSGTGSTQYQSCGDQKECVPRWLCANSTINTDGYNLIDVRIDTGSECQSYLDKCCDLLSKVTYLQNANTPIFNQFCNIESRLYISSYS